MPSNRDSQRQRGIGAMSYVVTSVPKTGTITYHCSSTHAALQKLHDFQQAEYEDITITTSDEQIISTDQLRSLSTQESTCA